jgi:hypothetical protein
MSIMDLMRPLLILLTVLAICSMPAIALQRPWVGLCLAWLGAILGAGIALGVAMLYIKYVHVRYVPRNDSDWSGVGDYIVWFIVIPTASSIAGLWQGYRYASRRERGPGNKPSSVPFEDVMKKLKPLRPEQPPRQG